MTTIPVTSQNMLDHKTPMLKIMQKKPASILRTENILHFIFL